MTTTVGVRPIYSARRVVVEFVDLPELAFLAIEGEGAPDSEQFADARQALHSVSHAAHWLLREEEGEAPRVRPLEALWWAAEPEVTLEGAPRSDWHWQAMIRQPAPIDERTLERAIDRTRARGIAAIDKVQLIVWAEGPAAQTLHVGPSATEATTIATLHAAIAQAGCRPRGQHHEIYLDDRRRSSLERSRTLLRQAVEAA